MSEPTPSREPLRDSTPDRLRILNALEEEPHLRRQLLHYGSVVRRRLWVPILLSLLTTAGAWIHFSRIPTRFQAQGIVQIGMNAGMSMDPGEYMLWAAGRDRIIRTQERLLTSDEVVETALRSLGREVPRGKGRRAALQGFLAGIQVSPDGDSYLVTVTAQGGEPKWQAQRVNALMDAFIPFTSEFMISRYQTMERQLGEQVAIFRANLREKEDERNELYAQNGHVQVDPRREGLLQRQREFEVRLSDLQIRSASLEAEQEMLQRGLSEQVSEEGLELLLGGLRSKTLQSRLQPLAELRANIARLEVELRDGHPELLQLRQQLKAQRLALRQVARAALAALELEAEVAAKEEEKLQGVVEELREEVGVLDRLAGRYTALERDIKWFTQELDATRARHRRAESRSQLDMGTTKIMSRAEVPEDPLPSHLLASVSLSSVLALILGGLLVMGWEFLEDTISSEEGARLLGPPLLGRIPQVDLKYEDEQLVLRGSKSHAAESFRDVRTHLAFSTTDARRTAIVVSSGGPRDGKTFVALNLAAAIARAGSRTLLVDGDMRRPRLQVALGTAFEEGLSDLLVGRAKLEDVVRPTGLEGLDFLPSGPRPPNPSDLLATDRFQVFLAAALERYDQVVIDSPPADVVSDPTLMSRHVSGVVFVVRLHRSRRRPLERAIEQVEGVGGRCLGLVLNGLTSLDEDHYGYDYRYGG